MMKTTCNLLSAALISISTLAAASSAEKDTAWQALREKTMTHGCRAERIDPTLGACRRRGLDATEAGLLLEPVYAAMTEQLPVDCLYERIDEGLAKKVDADRIGVAVQHRLECLREARQLVSAAHGGNPGGKSGKGPSMLIANVGMALESGVPPEVLEPVFEGRGRMRFGRMAHLVEAAEALHLAGLDAGPLQRVMEDMRAKNMNRNEMIRVVALIREELVLEKDFDTFYPLIWDSSGGGQE